MGCDMRTRRSATLSRIQHGRESTPLLAHARFLENRFDGSRLLGTLVPGARAGKAHERWQRTLLAADRCVLDGLEHMPSFVVLLSLDLRAHSAPDFHGFRGMSQLVLDYYILSTR
jgi:hypothetical protein